jgi:DNA-binding HxlR family transcriptional regulator
MELTKEQELFYKSLENMSSEERRKLMCEAKECVKNTGFNYTLSLINGKYKMTILYTIAQFGTIRTNEMQRYIADISFKTLSSNLKELERDGLISRREYPQVPPKVEYTLTEKGKTLIPILNAMCAWGYMHEKD